MISTCCYGSPLGDILLAADEVSLIGLWFEGQKYFANTLPVGHCAQTTPVPCPPHIPCRKRRH